METHDNKFYYKPVPANKDYDNALRKASYLTEQGYVNLTDGYKFEQLLEELIEQELLKNKLEKRIYWIIAPVCNRS